MDIRETGNAIRMAVALALAGFMGAPWAKVAGDLMQWHRVAIEVEGPMASEAGEPNPFRDYRMQVEFSGPGGKKYSVPGFFAADGKAGETGATAGNVWRAWFAPDLAGTWAYKVSLRAGNDVAISGDAAAGTAAAGDGETGNFQVAPTDKTGRDFRGHGRLEYVDGHHLRFAGSKKYFLKCGPDSPENLLGYADFDGTSKANGALKTWEPHVRDWKAGDPTWKGGKGKGLIGAFNYLAAQGMNTVSFLTFNPTGDAKDVWMFTAPGAQDRYDCSKLDQWEIAFSHADQNGLHLHFKTQETEVDQAMDDGDLGPTRKLYYRELIARFGHHLALNWNLGEEVTQTVEQLKACAAYFHAQDPYGHPIVVHTYPNEHDEIYGALKGSASRITGLSIQTAWDNVYAATRKWRDVSAAAGRKWVVANDEQGSPTAGVAADAGYTGNKGTVADNRDGIRHQTLWGNIMAGGGGVEYYFGYGTGETDLSAQDFRSRQTKWSDGRVALDFFQTNGVPFWDMAPANFSSAGWTLAKAGEEYVVYLPAGGSPTLDLTGAPGKLAVRWLNPRNGDLTQPKTVNGGGKVALGAAPASGDWVAWIRKDSGGTALAGDARRVKAAAATARVRPDGRAATAKPSSTGAREQPVPLFPVAR